LDEALVASQRAVEADVRGDVLSALENYQLAISLLQQVALGPPCPRLRTPMPSPLIV